MHCLACRSPQRRKLDLTCDDEQSITVHSHHGGSASPQAGANKLTLCHQHHHQQQGQQQQQQQAALSNSSMIGKTPKGRGKDLSQGYLPQSETSGDTALTTESHTSTFAAESNQPGSISTLEEQQEGLPEEIKSKSYPSSHLLTAEDELLEDLEKHSLLDSDKVIIINKDGKAIWATPTVFHQDALQKLLKIVNKCSGEDHPLLAQADIPLLIDKKKGKYRHPDVAIWGEGRLEAEDEDGDFDRRYISINGFPGENSMNPHVIIEFSWTNKLETEIWKLQQQITDHIQALGVVKLGFLIKAKPAEGKNFPTVLDRNVPLSGFDVYCFRTGKTAASQALPDPFLKYRVGSEDADTMAIEISGTDLGHSNPEHGVRIPLLAIRRSCEKSGLVFKADATD